MRKILYSHLFNNDVRIAYNVLLKNKKLNQDNFDNNIALAKKKLLTFIISNIIIKFIFKVEYFLTMIAKEFVTYDHLIITQ